jgi:hypothetical protein
VKLDGGIAYVTSAEAEAGVTVAPEVADAGVPVAGNGGGVGLAALLHALATSVTKANETTNLDFLTRTPPSPKIVEPDV